MNDTIKAIMSEAKYHFEGYYVHINRSVGATPRADGTWLEWDYLCVLVVKIDEKRTICRWEVPTATANEHDFRRWCYEQKESRYYVAATEASCSPS